MKLRFQVNQSEAFRRGVDAPNSIVAVDVDPGKLDQRTRELISSRLRGIDVVQLAVDEEGNVIPRFQSLSEAEVQSGKKPKPILLMAEEPNFEALVAAAKENQAAVEKALAALQARNQKKD